MNESYNINSILNAVEDLYNKTNKKKIATKSNVLKNDDVPPQVDQIIREAEQYKKQITSKSKKIDEFNKLQTSEFEKDKNILLDEKKKLEEKIKEIQIFHNAEMYKFKTRLEHQTIIYKENYEKIIIENKDIKQRLENTKKQISSFQKIKSEILIAVTRLNETLSKSEIIGSITPIDFSSTENIEELDLEKNKETKD
tara:strand:+ start:99 stop:689 length:591 start_codon:yes stop_codon:yes gene_type:complete